MGKQKKGKSNNRGSGGSKNRQSSSKTRTRTRSRNSQASSSIDSVKQNSIPDEVEFDQDGNSVAASSVDQPYSSSRSTQTTTQTTLSLSKPDPEATPLRKNSHKISIVSSQGGDRDNIPKMGNVNTKSNDTDTESCCSDNNGNTNGNGNNNGNSESNESGLPKGLQAVIGEFTDTQQELAKKLCSEEAGQSHLFEHWDDDDSDNVHVLEQKKELMSQLETMDGSYPNGGLSAYITNAKTLLEQSRAGKNPLDGWEPSIPKGENFEMGSKDYFATESIGLKEVGKCGFVLVAGGLGERLGYSDIKVCM
jgi:hypothetical protein